MTSFIFSAPLVAGFIFPGQMKVKPGLAQIVDAQPTIKVNIKLDIGREDGLSRLGIKGMVFHLHKDRACNDSVEMPGNIRQAELRSSLLKTSPPSQFTSLLYRFYRR
jgi:hypothetical protein